MPLLAWLQAAGSRLGGQSLKRRQVNVFWWNGAATETEAAATIIAAESEQISNRAVSVAPSSSGGPAAGQQATTAYPGFGTWRAATIRGFDAATGRFEVK